MEKYDDKVILENKELNIWEAMIPMIFLIILLFFNVFYVFGDDALGGSNQFILLLSGAVAAIVGFYNKVSYKKMIDKVADNFKSTTGAILILLMVGALAGTWLLSGIIPTMIYYGLKILNPTIFLPATVIICAIISLATGSSWTTSATVGIALIGIGDAMGISMAMTAGAVISGAYFGDKMSPLSDTTNLASAMAGADLFDHIKYMTYTTVPSILITIVIFTVIGFTQETVGQTDTSSILNSIEGSFNINIALFLVPGIVIYMIIKKTKPLIALLIGSLLGGVFAVIFQPGIVSSVSGIDGELTGISAYKGVMNALTTDIAIVTENEQLNDLFTAGGMKGMLGTIWLIMTAMVFGGVMEAIGALSRISKALLSMAKSTFGLFASAVSSCLALNLTASDQYLSIVVSGKMYKDAFKERDLAPENLSRTLEDAGTVTSVLIPWNTCGAYQAGVLGVSVGEYFIYAIFNYISPFMTLLFAMAKIKIKRISSTSSIYKE
ncbi:MAG: Na+/H+ antiporter NhaC [Saprospiraceae bacterium]|nr:Na+/H+ antiporter NhaC [Bacteroidia bacterium]NNE15727.1 Na+/H+ antiporter NhaC [Saprospiraceae bacterium]NNL92168.1 Na+/H+ antiporter NhaC [Saprospiraceae bacterium]